MQHTLAAVFNTQSQAQKACEALISSGFSRDEVQLTQSEDTPADQAALDQDRSNQSSGSGSGIRSFFAELFGSGTNNDGDADLYSEAVMHGNYVLTVNVPDDDQVEEVAEVLDQYDPLDIDEQASSWKSGGWAAQGSMKQDQTQNLTQQHQTEDLNLSQQTQQRSGSISASALDSSQQQTSDEQQAIPVIQEELRVGKRAVQRGGVRVYQRVTETPVQENVNLREEHVSVERRPVNQPADLSSINALKEGTIEMREMAEEPVVEKVARVVEEVVVGKKVSQRQQQVRDTVRKTEVEVENLSGSSNLSGSAPRTGTTARSTGESSDAYFRNHWNSNYASSGGNYEEYAPAYQYGSSLSAGNRYTGRQWEDSESDVRRDWEAKNPGSTWEKMKGAVRHGWESMTNE